MCRIAVLPLLLGPGSAQAHPGGHLHPHGADPPLTLLLAGSMAAAPWAILRSRR